MTHRISNLLGSLGLVLGVLALGACQQRRDAAVAPVKDTAALTSRSSVAEVKAPAVTLVKDPSLVCMVNNQFMGMAQIPVEIEGRTYYGCCPMCRERLQGDAALRTAIDPLTQAPVDKASAVIGKTSTGAALYFAKLENLHAYAQRD
jgi:YHS domain-containing protein